MLLKEGPFFDNDSLCQQMQRVMVNQYRECRNRGEKLYERIQDAGFRCYSQFEEDGIILYVLTMIGATNRTVVEIGCGDGSECMAANLILNHGFLGFLFDGNKDNVDRAMRFFGSKKDCLLYRPKITHAWVTSENVNGIISAADAAGEVDLLSLDIDGNDYYIWEAVSVIKPRLCVFETHNIIPGDRSLTIHYDPDFGRPGKAGARDYGSVSLLAMKKLSEKKGYRLIGGHRHGFNVFFLRNDIAPDIFPEVPISEVHDNFWTREGQVERWPQVKNLNWREI